MSATFTAPADPYDRLAPVYDTLTAGYDHERWLTVLLALAEECGLRGRRALDVACGTGASAMPLLERGFAVTGVDRSAGMLAEARHRLGDAAVLAEADMRSLPRLGAFELVTCLDDSLNHLLSFPDLAAALEGMAANLACGGVLVFDVNTLRTLRAVFSSDWASADDRAAIFWHGRGPSDLPPGGVTSASISVVSAGGEDEVTVLERHHPLAEIREALWRAGMEPVAIRGQHRGARLDASADETVHHKLVIAARRPVGLVTWLRAHGGEGR
jgi:SAM-dependent methyltransferase